MTGPVDASAGPVVVDRTSRLEVTVRDADSLVGGVMDLGVLTLALAATSILAVRAVVRLVRGTVAWPALGVAAAVLWTLLAGVAAFHEVRHHRTQALATSATRLASGDPTARVDCVRTTTDLLSLSQYKGFVMRDDPTTSTLPSATCSDLARWVSSSKKSPSLDEVMAVHVVSHEAQHVAGELDEAVAECRALRWDAAVAERMGASPQQAAALAARYLAEVYPYLQDGYVRDCSTVP